MKWKRLTPLQKDYAMMASAAVATLVAAAFGLRYILANRAEAAVSKKSPKH